MAAKIRQAGERSAAVVAGADERILVEFPKTDVWLGIGSCEGRRSRTTALRSVGRREMRIRTFSMTDRKPFWFTTSSDFIHAS